MLCFETKKIEHVLDILVAGLGKDVVSHLVSQSTVHTMIISIYKVFIESWSEMFYILVPISYWLSLKIWKCMESVHSPD